MNVNILVAGTAILLAAGAAILAVLAKVAIKDMPDPQREAHLPPPAPTPKPKDHDREPEHVG